MSQDEKQICLNCRWWDSENGDNGFCRRWAPDKANGLFAAWPVTSGHDWCGEFTAKPLSEEDKRFLQEIRPVCARCRSPEHHVSDCEEDAADTFHSFGDLSNKILADADRKRKEQSE